MDSLLPAAVPVAISVLILVPVALSLTIVRSFARSIMNLMSASRKGVSLMASSSRKYVCPKCFRSVRSTSRNTCVICGYCEILMKYVRPYGQSLEDARRPDDTQKGRPE